MLVVPLPFDLPPFNADNVVLRSASMKVFALPVTKRAGEEVWGILCGEVGSHDSAG